MDMFDQHSAEQYSHFAPLAERMRPTDITEYAGQKHILGEGRILKKLIESDSIPSLILWGPPGSGKTTLAKVIAGRTCSNFIFFSAILSGVKEIREIISKAKDARKYHGRKTIVFVDEIHRFSKSQQDAFLPAVEDGTFTIIGATTENPSFEIISPLISRCTLLLLKPLDDEDIEAILKRALEDQVKGLGKLDMKAGDETVRLIASLSTGDARSALNTLEKAAAISNGIEITPEAVYEAFQQKKLGYDKNGEEHYNVISAFIKSMRGSDPDASLYWLARMIEAGEDPVFILRRMIVLASEDIGNADPRALQVAVSALQGVQCIGMPEGRIIMAQAVTYLATAPKSNASYLGIDNAISEVRSSGALPVPLHLRNAPTKLMKDAGYGKAYEYPHDLPSGFSSQSYFPDKAVGKRFYVPAERGYEKMISERMKFIRNKNS